MAAYPDIIARIFDNKRTKICFVNHNDAVEFAKNAIKKSHYPIVCGIRVASYSWH